MTPETRKAELVQEGIHLLGKFDGSPDGKTLIVIGGIHGNESAGVKAILRVLPKLRTISERLTGNVYLLAGNTRALSQGIRFIDSDLNRHWSEVHVKRNQPAFFCPPLLAEDHEQRELLEILNSIISTSRAEVYALDLHSTSAEGVPFGTVGDTLRNRYFAQSFPITFLLGIEEQLEGTILEYLNNLGAVTLGFEGGQHFSEKTIDTHEAMIWLALVNSGILTKEETAEYDKQHRLLKQVTGGKRIVEIRYRHAITAADKFEMCEGFDNFQSVSRGQVLAHDKNGEVKAEESGMILMPLYQKLGEDGFFLGREVAPFWLRVSELLRKIHLPDFVEWLPGVRKDESAEGVYHVNTKIARLFPLQVFHLLGFRKLRKLDNELIVSRRLHDTESPFVRA